MIFQGNLGISTDHGKGDPFWGREERKSEGNLRGCEPRSTTRCYSGGVQKSLGSKKACVGSGTRALTIWVGSELRCSSMFAKDRYRQ